MEGRPKMGIGGGPRVGYGTQWVAGVLDWGCPQIGYWVCLRFLPQCMWCGVPEMLFHGLWSAASFYP